MNPFRSEAAAFRFLVATVAAFAAIAAAKIAVGSRAALVVWVLVTAAAVAWYVRHRRGEPPAKTAPPHRGAEDERRILVVANETAAGEELLGCVRERCEGWREHVLVVAPALTSRVKLWANDEDGARREALDRLAGSVDRLRAAGLRVDDGVVGDADPLQAIEDALRAFGADEIVLATHPEGRSNWLERRVVEQARDRFDLPITHVVVDLAAEPGRAAS